MRNVLIVVLVSVVVWLASVIVRLENYRYANSIGMCSEHVDLIQKENCLNAQETRTSPLWHLAYALGLI
jgi:hypothetical protein